MKKPTVILAASLALAGCAQTGTIIPATTGSQAIGKGYSDTDSIAQAVSTAVKHCGKFGKSPTVSSRETKYKGMLSEQNRKTADTVQAIATYAGAWLPTPNGDEDYTTTITFDCI
ncbi:MAG: hypothetical protein KBT88_03470 [Gammaproteobacteria bacterium]|nr:hypothetical protein [Gammaproteobacteria bacterium]MBQ0838820.1 hypothetical protein [Gammaproteobacteria bacterium]